MKYLTILLQAVPTVDPSTNLWTRVGDQLFTIVLLVTISYLLWQRITKVQDRLDNYLNEDRKEMQEVINNNTEVMKEVLHKLKA